MLNRGAGRARGMRGVGLLAAALCTTGAVWVGSASSAFAATGGTAYVATNSGTVDQFNIATNRAAGRPIALASGLLGIAITPDAGFAYATNAAGGTVTPINLEFNQAMDPLTQAIPGAQGIAFSPDGRTGYVAEARANALLPFTPERNVTRPPIPVGPHPVAVAVTPDGSTAYVANLLGASVTPIDLTTDRAQVPISVGAAPSALAVTPDGKTLYVVNQSSGNVTPITVATNIAHAPIQVGLSPDAIAITPDSDTVYVANAGSGTVTPISTFTNTAGPSIAVGPNPGGVAVGPDGQTAYVTNYSGASMTPINVRSDTPGPPIPTDAYPAGIAISPASITNMRIDPSEISTVGTRVAGRDGCLPLNTVGRDIGPCRLAQGLHISYRTDTASRVNITLQQQHTGRRVGNRCVAPSNQNQGRPSCVTLETYPGASYQQARAGNNTMSMSDYIYGGRHLPDSGTFRLTLTPVGGTPVSQTFSLLSAQQQE